MDTLAQATASAVDVNAAPTAATENADNAAERLSANCFFNALIRETGLGEWITESRPWIPDGIALPALRIALPAQGASLWLNASYRSLFGRHQFNTPIRYQDAQGHSRTINLALAAHVIASEPGIFPQAEPRQRHQFTERVQMSVRNMAQAIRARQDDFPRLFGKAIDFAEAEQALLCGHSIHPTPKSREPFTDTDAETYAPEFGNTFTLQWLAIHAARLEGKSGCSELTAADFARKVWASENMQDPVPDTHVPVPMHPWQWQRLRQYPDIARLIEAGDIIELGQGCKPWRATSSLRAIHAGHSPYMLKFSLSLRLTNSLRTLLPHEMARGLEIPQVRSTPIGREFADRYPAFSVLAEPAFLMLRDAQGEALSESMVLFRENPFRETAADNCCLLATLTQDHPFGGMARAAQLVARYGERRQLDTASACAEWFEAFMDAVLEPLLIAQADYGLLYGAHQQNLIIRFENELPRAGYFRDCQGSGYSQLGAELLKPHLPNLGSGTENVIDDVMANRLFAYYLIVNSCFGLISALAAAGVSTESHLLSLLRARLEKLQAGPRRDRSCLNYLLEADELWAKGNFHCAIIGLNETTTEDPLAIYHRMPNPLKHVIQPQARIAS